jgi:hypothetical protein
MSIENISISDTISDVSGRIISPGDQVVIPYLTGEKDAPPRLTFFAMKAHAIANNGHTETMITIYSQEPELDADLGHWVREEDYQTLVWFFAGGDPHRAGRPLRATPMNLDDAEKGDHIYWVDHDLVQTELLVLEVYGDDRDAVLVVMDRNNDWVGSIMRSEAYSMLSAPGRPPEKGIAFRVLGYP